MTRKQRHLLTRIIVAAVLFLAGSLLHLPELAEMAVFLACYVVVGWDIVWKAITNILHGQVFDENFLMTIATIGALILGEHSEGVAVMLFYQVGEWFQSYAVSKSRKSIASLMDIRPDYANIERDGKLVQVDPDEVQIGETIVVNRESASAGRYDSQRLLHPGHFGPDRRIHAPRGGAGNGGHQRLYQPDRHPEHSDHKRIWGIHRSQNP